MVQEMSSSLISRIIDSILLEVREWQSFPNIEYYLLAFYKFTLIHYFATDKAFNNLRYSVISNP